MAHFNKKTTLKQGKAICWINDEILIIYRKSAFYLYNVSDNTMSKLCNFMIGNKYRFFSRFFITRRLFRLYPQSPLLIQKTKELIFSFRGCIYSVNIENGLLTKEQNLAHNATRVLSFCIGKDEQIFYGEYSTKNDGEPISIWKRSNNKTWDRVYSFPANAIRHIHLLKEYKNSLYCFTGDEDNETKILSFANNNFLNEPFIIASNNQKFRTCVAVFKDNQLYYLTDNPYFKNHLYSYNIINKEICSLFDIEGSVIYGLCDADHLFFSTSVEKNLSKDKHNKNVTIKIDGQNGGIRSKFASIYSFDLKTRKMEKIFSLKKDYLSIKYFGLGSFVFTCNSSKKYLAATASALKKDECIFIFQKEEQ